MTKRSLDSLVLTRLGIDCFLSVPVIPYFAPANAREDAVCLSQPLAKYGGDHEGWTKEELIVDTLQCWVVREFPSPTATSAGFKLGEVMILTELS